MQHTRPSICSLAVISCLVLVVASPAAGELVVLVGGAVLKVDAFQLEGEQARLTLPAGGVLKMPLLRIERIVDDEIVPETESEPTLENPLGITFQASHSVPQTPYGELIYEAARRHELNPRLVAAVVQAESAFDPEAVSPKGASGLLQLMPATAGRFGLEPGGIFDPDRNLEAGVRYLKWLSERFDGELSLILAGYNAGEATVDRYNGVPPFRETHDYIRRVYSLLGVGGAQGNQ